MSHAGHVHVTCKSCACHMFMYLSLCVHDADCVCPIAHDELIRDFGQVMHSIHCHILLPREGGFEGVRTLCGLHVPELSCMGGGGGRWRGKERGGEGGRKERERVRMGRDRGFRQKEGKEKGREEGRKGGREEGERGREGGRRQNGT